jgi:hypothetical protein
MEWREEHQDNTRDTRDVLKPLHNQTLNMLVAHNCGGVEGRPFTPLNRSYLNRHNIGDRAHPAIARIRCTDTVRIAPRV